MIINADALNGIVSRKPVVFFDSGVGGLTILDEARRRLPDLDLIYVADTAFVPYGDKPPEVIVERAVLFADWAFGRSDASHRRPQNPAQALVIPCNTATLLAAQHLRTVYPNAVIVGVEPGIKPALSISRAAKVGVWATRNTAQSQRFTSRLAQLHQQANGVALHVQACQGLAEAIERFAENPAEAAALNKMLQDYWLPLADAGVDTLVLGCTHYPLVKTMIRDLVGEQVSLVETATPVIDQLCRRLGLSLTSKPGGALPASGDTGLGSNSAASLLYCTGDKDVFSRQVAGLCQQGALPALASSGWQIESFGS